MEEINSALLFDLGGVLAFMQQRGSSVVLNYGEDNDVWECSWITSGKRYTSFSGNAFDACRMVLLKVRDS